MKKLLQRKNKATWLLLTGILVLCAGFIIIGCGAGTDPQLKVQDPDARQTALDYSVCPVSGCISAFSTSATLASEDQLTNKPLTFEAWVKPQAASGTLLFRGSSARGAKMELTFTPATNVGATSTPSSLIPSFKILRSVVSSSPAGTSTASYVVNGIDLTVNSWQHLAGILTNQVHTHAVCTNTAPDGDPRDDNWHIDIYQAGTYIDCAGTYGGLTAFGDAQPTSAAAAYADEPAALDAGPGPITGIIDEARIWTVERSINEMNTCRGRELEQSGICGYNEDSDNMILYVKFNEGEGHSITDFTGTFAGGLEYPDPDVDGHFLEWNTGWTTDTPF